jgi:chromate transporter
MLALAKLLQRSGSLGAIRGILNGLRRAVAALITSAAIMFVTLSIWNVDKVSAVATMSSTDLLAVFVLVVAVIVAYKKWLGAIQTIIGGGVLYMVLQLLLH